MSIVFFTGLVNGVETPTSDSWVFGEGGLRTGLCAFIAGPGKETKGGEKRYAVSLTFKGGENDGQSNGTDTFQINLPEKESERATAVARVKTFVMSCNGAVRDVIKKLDEKKGKWTAGLDADTGDLHLKWQTDKSGTKVFKAADVTGYCYVHGAPPREEWPTKIDPKTQEVKVETQYAQVDYITSDKHAAVENGTFRPPAPRSTPKKGAAQTGGGTDVGSVRSQERTETPSARQVERQSEPSDNDAAPPPPPVRIPAVAQKGPPARPVPAPVTPVAAEDEAADEP